MSGGTPTQIELPRRFEHPGRRPNPGLLKAIGLPLACIGVASIVLLPLAGIDTGPLGLIAAVIVLIAGIMLAMKAGHARAIADVTVDKAGLIIERAGEAREIPWTDLRWAEQNSAGGHIYLMLYGREMKLTDRISNSIEGFETLCKLVEARFNERPSEEVAQAYGKRSSAFARRQLYFGVPLVVLGGILVYLAQIMPNELPRLNKDGEFGWAEVIDIYQSDKDRIPLLKYRVVVDDQRGPVETVRMEPEAWRALKAQTYAEDESYVEVSYLPGDLSVSFARGQEMPSGKYTPTLIYLKAGLAFFIGFSMLWSAYRHRSGREHDIVAAINEQRRRQADATSDPDA